HLLGGVDLLAGGQCLATLVRDPLVDQPVGVAGGVGDHHGDGVEPGLAGGEGTQLAVDHHDAAFFVVVGPDRQQDPSGADAGDQVTGCARPRADVVADVEVGGRDVAQFGHCCSFGLVGMVNPCRADTAILVVLVNAVNGVNGV